MNKVRLRRFEILLLLLLLFALLTGGRLSRGAQESTQKILLPTLGCLQMRLSDAALSLQHAFATRSARSPRVGGAESYI